MDLKDAVLTIGKLSKATGVNISTIRYYEQTGLLPRPNRSEGNQRRYSDSERRRLSFIRQARELGMTIEAVRGLLDLDDGVEVAKEDADRIVAEQLSTVSEKIQRLCRLEAELRRVLADASTVRPGRVDMIASLAD